MARLTFAPALVLLALAACDREEPRSPSVETAPKGAPPPATAAPAQPAAGATPVEPTPVPVAGRPCRSGELTLKRVSTDAGAGNRVATFALGSVAPSACTLAGYPTIALFDANGRKLEARVVQTEQTYFDTGGPPAPVVLAPNGRAVFHLAWGVVPSDAGPCLSATRLQVTPPGGDQALESEEQIEFCGGQLRVSPVRIAMTAPSAPTSGAAKPKA